jgi:tetratricopeptide (TPR) repeat protein
MRQKIPLKRTFLSALDRGDLDGARAILERLEAKDPLSAETRGLRLRYLLRKGAREEASRLAEQLLKTFPASPGILFWCGKAAYLNKDYKYAVRLFRESFRLEPHPSAEQALGNALTNLGVYDEAEPILRRLSERWPKVLLDLAWLHERRGDFDQALRAVESYRESFPDNEFAKEKERRLRAKRADGEDLIEEIETLVDLGEEIPAEILPEAFERLSAAGRGDEARELVRRQAADLEPRRAIDIGWAAHRLAAYDVSYELFVEAFPSQPRNFKLLGALEKAARLTGRLEDLAKRYKAAAEANPGFHGRLKRVRRQIEKENKPD